MKPPRVWALWSREVPLPWDFSAPLHPWLPPAGKRPLAARRLCPEGLGGEMLLLERRTH